MKVGIIKGNGIGPEISEAAMLVLSATGLPIEWESIAIGDDGLEKYGHPLPPESVKRIKSIGLALKAPLIVNKQQGRLSCVQDDGSSITYPSLNNAIRRELSLFVNPRPIRGVPNLSGTYEKLDTVIMREITEDVYIGIERRIDSNTAEAIKRITRPSSTRLAQYAFDYARRNGRSKVTCIHKANVLNFTDGLFLECCQEVAKAYPDIEFDDLMIDAACYHVVKNPERFDVIASPNQYGDIFSDLCAGLVGSLGLAPGANIGSDCAVFEASHGAAPDIAGQGIANPIALILSGALLLRHCGEMSAAQRVEDAVQAILAQPQYRTRDLGGEASSQKLTEALVNHIDANALAQHG